MFSIKSNLARTVALLLVLVPTTGRGERVKDLAAIAGVRDNQLIGYGLVVGLDGTGDQTGQIPFTEQSLRSMLTQLGINIPASVPLQPKNVAAAALHATLPPFARPGQTIDVTVSSIGNSKSLRGGSLLVSPLRGVDGQVYALAQGNVMVAGLGIVGADGNSVSVNVPTVGRIPNGAAVERSAPTELGDSDSLTLILHRADFTTAARMADAINEELGSVTAQPLDSATIRVRAPADRGTRVSFLSTIENLSLEPGEAAARIIINSRTGTVVIGRYVRVHAAAVAHGSLSVTISQTPSVSQPAPFGQGNTVESNRTEIEVVEETARAFVFSPGVSLDEIVRAINEVGATPTDLVAILQALKEAGALRAELVVI